MAGSPATPSRWHRGGWLPLVLGVLLAGVVAGCASGEEAQAHVTVNMLDDFFGRDLTRVPIGTSVRFVNDGRNPHNAVDAKGAWTTPIDMHGGDAKLVRFSQPGVYRFYCTFHGTADGKGMAATLVVGNASYNPAEQATGETLAPVARASGRVRRVPQQHRTIQAAVNAARPGDLVLIGPGVYREEVKVTTIGLGLAAPLALPSC
jgi:plastocyanin